MTKPDLVGILSFSYHCNCLETEFQVTEPSTLPFPETEVPGRLQAELMSRGLRMTRQRRTILSVVETAKQHLDASQILRHARKVDPQIDRVTVYRTLTLLKRNGLVVVLDIIHLAGGSIY